LSPGTSSITTARISKARAKMLRTSDEFLRKAFRHALALRVLRGQDAQHRPHPGSIQDSVLAT